MYNIRHIYVIYTTTNNYSLTANGPHGRGVLLAPPAFVNVDCTGALITLEAHALHGRVTHKNQLQGLCVG